MARFCGVLLACRHAAAGACAASCFFLAGVWEGPAVLPERRCSVNLVDSETSPEGITHFKNQTSLSAKHKQTPHFLIKLKKNPKTNKPNSEMKTG